MRVRMMERRKELGLTQEAVANKATIARTTYTSIELGDKNPSLTVAIKLKEVLKYSNDDIFFND